MMGGGLFGGNHEGTGDSGSIACYRTVGSAFGSFCLGKAWRSGCLGYNAITSRDKKVQ